MNKIAEMLRPLLVKIITRGVLYGTTALCTALSINAAEANDSATMIGAGLGGLASLGLAAMIDRWHAKKDLAEPPK